MSAKLPAFRLAASMAQRKEANEGSIASLGVVVLTIVQGMADLRESCLLYLLPWVVARSFRCRASPACQKHAPLRVAIVKLNIDAFEPKLAPVSGAKRAMWESRSEWFQKHFDPQWFPSLVPACLLCTGANPTPVENELTPEETPAVSFPRPSINLVWM